MGIKKDMNPLTIIYRPGLSLLFLWQVVFGQDSLNVRWINSGLFSCSRRTYCAEIGSNKYEFTYLHGGILVLNVNNPASPQKVVEIGTPGDPPRWLIDGGTEIVDTLLYLTIHPYGLWIYNIADISNPIRIGECKTPHSCGVTVAGNYAYVADDDSGLIIIDISQPSSPQRVGKFYTYPGGCDVIVSDTIAYLAAGKVWVINIKDPYNPSLISVWAPHGNSETALQIDKEGDFLYVTERGIFIQGFWIIDVSNPQNPISADSVIVSWASDIVASGQYAYGSTDNRMLVINITNPYDAYVEAILSIPRSGQGIFYYNDYVYLANSRSTLIIDVNDPKNPFIVGSYNHGAYTIDVAISNNYAYVSKGSELKVLDISNLNKLNLIGHCATPDVARGLAVLGNYVYIADSDSGLRIIDISNPYAPQQIGSYIAQNYFMVDVIVDCSFAYIAVGSHGLLILDVSDPRNPIFVNSYTPPGGYSNSIKVYKNGLFVYLLCDPGGLKIIDVSNPYAPYQIGTFYPEGGINGGIGIRGNFAFLAGVESVNGSFCSLDIDDPSSPMPLDFLLDYWVNHGDLKLLGNRHAIVGTPNGPIFVADVQDPFNLRWAGYYQWEHSGSAGPSYQIDLKDNYIFVATDCGLQIFEFTGEAGIKLTSSNHNTHKINLTIQPNPFTLTTKISWHIQNNIEEGIVEIYNSAGQSVRNYPLNSIKKNDSFVIWDGTDSENRTLPGGVYFFVFNLNNFKIAKKIVYLK